MEVIDGEATLELPDYFRFLNENPDIWCNPAGHFGSAYGEIDADQRRLVVRANQDGLYKVLIIATRKDEVAKTWFDAKGVEYIKQKEAA